MLNSKVLVITAKGIQMDSRHERWPGSKTLIPLSRCPPSAPGTAMHWDLRPSWKECNTLNAAGSWIDHWRGIMRDISKMVVTDLSSLIQHDQIHHESKMTFFLAQLKFRGSTTPNYCVWAINASMIYPMYGTYAWLFGVVHLHLFDVCWVFKMFGHSFSSE